MKSKYIIVETDGMEVPLIFSPFLCHENVTMVDKSQIQSAGYCELDAQGKWIVSGQSISLKLNARLQDAEILNAQLGIKSTVVTPSLKPACTKS